MRVSLGKRFLLGTLGAPAGVLGSGVEGARRNQLLIAQIMKILKSQRGKERYYRDTAPGYELQRGSRRKDRKLSHW